MKIQKIEVQNFKAVSSEVAEFNGCSAIITAGNRMGKTSLLRGLIDRLRGEKPDIIVKSGEEKGYNIIELTDKSRIEWKFTEKTETFAYISPDGIKQTTGVIQMIGERYFGTKFDIDKFLNMPPKQQVKELQKLTGLDFEEIDQRYKEAFESRTEANREQARLKSQSLQQPEKVEKPDIDGIKARLLKVRMENQKKHDDWIEKNDEYRIKIDEFNEAQRKINTKWEDTKELLDDLLNMLKGSIFEDCFELKLAEAKFAAIPKPAKLKEYTRLDAPEYEPQEPIEKELEVANEQMRAFDAYNRMLDDCNSLQDKLAEIGKEVEKRDQAVKKIEAERKEMIASAKLPKEFEITEDGINYNGFPLTDAQMATSDKYIAALKLGSLVLGEIRTMHFDASFLDKPNLSSIQKWAEVNDLQLLIERPDYEGGAIRYEIINH